MIRIIFAIVLIQMVCINLSFSQSSTYHDFQEKQIKQYRKNGEWAKTQPYLILLSIDGFRYDYAHKFGATNLLSLAEEGASAERMIPCFPSKTFPNHYSIVTGQYPGTHGIVSNEFFSRSKNEWYAIQRKEAVQDSSWYGGVPLWVLAEQNKMNAASLFWVGSEAPIGGLMPTYSYSYDGSVPNEYRIRQIIDWLKLPAEERPHLVLGYFSLVDDVGHRYGPDHPETKRAVLEIDSLIGQLRASLSDLDLPVHLVLVSDHGMSSISHGLVLPDMVELGDAEVSYSFPPMIYQDDQQEVDRMYYQLLKHDLLEVYKKDNLPNYLNFKNDDAIGDLVVITKAPTVVLPSPRPVSGGTHGFDPFTNEEMGAIFYASGPLIKPGVVLSPFENIHLYPFIAQILGLPVPSEVEGSLDALSPILKID